MTRIIITPKQLREIADDLERKGPNFVRTVIDSDGNEIDFELPETEVDNSDPSWPREVHRGHLDADKNHQPDHDANDDTCRTCGLAVTSDGKRHGFDA